MSHRTYLWIAVALLLAYWLARTWALNASPPFIDEAVHVNFGREVLASGPFARSQEGRQFVIWLYILFGAQSGTAILVARVATLLTTLLGGASVIGTARLLANRWGALFAGILLITSPYHHFFERMALADPISAALVMLAIFFAARLAKRADPRDAALCGVALFLAIGSKLTALPALAIPLVAMLTLRRNRAGLRWMVVALGVGIALGATYFGLVIWRGYNPFTLLRGASSSEATTIFLPNAIRTIRMIIDYFGIPAALVMLAGIFVLLLRRRFFLPLSCSVLVTVLWFSARQESRFTIVPVTLLLLIVAVALGILVEQKQVGRLAPLAALAVVLIWGLVLWLPFAVTAARSPDKIALPANDYTQYVRADGSGFGLREVVAALENRHPTRVIGVLSNCWGLYEMAPFPVECPRMNPNGEDVQALANLLAASREAGVYAVLETTLYAPSSAPGRVIATIDANRPRLTIYDLTP